MGFVLNFIKQLEYSKVFEAGIRISGLFRNIASADPCRCSIKDTLYGARWLKWLEGESTDRNVRGANPTSASRLTLSMLEHLGCIPARVLPSGGMAVRHRKGATAELPPPYFEEHTNLQINLVLRETHLETS
ncbi:hypothetical protein CSKR_101464 [Clonorchis sinensis]|uniref:Uncharacterized protein n=2 Tax=Clonorchis sinensis TaxID=79923 RepID=G7YPZ4_CLOSI|nr:hypothetical protein CSKR_101464 [Clonorchis sinensis]GAA55025.1 hypothetical protein CLF_106486 [Clonorchis sinensis]